MPAYDNAKLAKARGVGRARFWLTLAAASGATTSQAQTHAPAPPGRSYPHAPAGAPSAAPSTGHPTSPLAIRRVRSIPGIETLSSILLKSDGEGGTFLAARASGPVNVGGNTLVGDPAGDLLIARFDSGGQHLFSVLFRGQGSGRQSPIEITDDPRRPEWVRVLLETDEEVDFRPAGGCPVQLPPGVARRFVDLGVGRQDGRYRGTTRYPDLATGQWKKLPIEQEVFLYGYTRSRVGLTTLPTTAPDELAASGGWDLVLARYLLPETTPADEEPCVALPAEATLLAAARLGTAIGDGQEWINDVDPLQEGPDGTLKLKAQHMQSFAVGTQRVDRDSGGEGICSTEFRVDRQTFESFLSVDDSSCARSTETPPQSPPPPGTATPLMAQFAATPLQSSADQEAAAQSGLALADASDAFQALESYEVAALRAGPPFAPSAELERGAAPAPAAFRDLRYVFGTALGDITLSNSAGTWILPQREATGENGYLAAFDAETDELAWARVFGGRGRQAITSLEVGPGGDLAVAGEFEGHLGLGTGTLRSAGGTDVFVARLSPGGRLLSHRRLGGAGDESVSGLVVSSIDGLLHLAGQTEQGFALGTGSLQPGAFLLQLGGQQFSCQSDGYDDEGFDEQGFDRRGFDRDGFNAQGFDATGHDEEGFDAQSFDRRGFDRNGVSAQGLDAAGYNRRGFDAKGFDRQGFRAGGYNRRGFDRQGFDREGFNRRGFDRQGYDCDGFDRAGFDRQGYNREGFDRAGFDRAGFDRQGYNREGFNLLGVNRRGFYGPPLRHPARPNRGQN